MTLSPITLREARAFVARVHRHHRPPQGGLFAVAVALGEEVCGVAIVGRPVSRHLQDGFTAEVTRLATDGAKNACSMLYGAAWRAARALGYRRLITYTLPDEGGISLIAAGWRVVGKTKEEGWSRTGRPRVDDHPLQQKLRWQAGATPPAQVPLLDKRGGAPAPPPKPPAARADPAPPPPPDRAVELTDAAIARARQELFESHTTDGTDGAGACRYELIYVREKDAEAVRRCPSPCARDRKVNVQGAAGAKQPCASCGKLTSYVETQGRA